LGCNATISIHMLATVASACSDPSWSSDRCPIEASIPARWQRLPRTTSRQGAVRFSGMVAHLPEAAPRRWIGLICCRGRVGATSEEELIVVSAMVSLALTASLADHAATAPFRNKKQAHQLHAMTKPPPRPQRGGSGYYENVLDKVPFGTQRWWAIKQRRSGGGG
jgi:hypothetical protein